MQNVEGLKTEVRDRRSDVRKQNMGNRKEETGKKVRGLKSEVRSRKSECGKEEIEKSPG